MGGRTLSVFPLASYVTLNTLMTFAKSWLLFLSKEALELDQIRSLFLALIVSDPMNVCLEILTVTKTQVEVVQKASECSKVEHVILPDILMSFDNLCL